MGQDPDAIRREIEETRERMGATVEALGYKADVPARSKEAVTDKVQGVTGTVQEKVQGVKESIIGAKDTVADKASGATDTVSGQASGVAGTISDRTPSAQDVKQGARRAVGIAQSNPLGLAIGSVAVGFLAGMLVPSTRFEDENIGPVADQVKDQVRETGQEALERGKQVAQEAAQSAQQTAKESGQQQAQELASSAQPS